LNLDIIPDLNPADWAASAICNHFIGGDEKALTNAADAWNELSKDLNNISTALASPINALHGHNWSGESRDKFIGSYANPLQSQLKEGAAHAKAIADNLTTTAKALHTAKQAIYDIVNTVAITLVASIVTALLTGGLAAPEAGAADAAAAASVVARVLRVTEECRVAITAIKFVNAFARAQFLAVGMNMAIKAAIKVGFGQYGAGNLNNLLIWSPKDWSSLVLADTLWGAGAATINVLGLSPLQQVTLGGGLNFALPMTQSIVLGRNLGKSTVYALESGAIATLAFAIPNAKGILQGATTGVPAWRSLALNQPGNLAGDRWIPGYRQGRGDLASGDSAKLRFQLPSFSSLGIVLPMAPAAGVVPRYTVKPGDNLWNIAAQQYPNHDPHQYPNIYWGTNANTQTKIANPNLIYPGQQIQILPERTSGQHPSAPLPVPPVNGYQPVSGASLPPAPPPTTHHLAPGGSGSAPHQQAGGSGIVTVRPGDTLSAIAQRNHLSLQQLEAANRGLGNPNHIYPGEEVVIPGQAAA